MDLVRDYHGNESAYSKPWTFSFGINSTRFREYAASDLRLEKN